MQRGPAHEQAGDAAEAVEDSHHFRHRGHRHQTRRERADDTAHHQPQDNPPELDDGLVQQGDDHGEQHTAGGHQVAVACGGRRTQHLQAEDEQYRRRDVRQVNPQGVTHCSSPSFFLNMDNMRLVTM